MRRRIRSPTLFRTNEHGLGKGKRCYFRIVVRGRNEKRVAFKQWKRRNGKRSCLSYLVRKRGWKQNCFKTGFKLGF